MTLIVHHLPPRYDERMSTAAIIVAAGRGTRAGAGLPKQWRDLGGQCVAAHTLDVFAGHPMIGDLVLVLHPDDVDSTLWPRRPGVRIVTGGATRQASVWNGLQALDDAVENVLIHDAARPLVSAQTITDVITALAASPAAAPALPVTDTLWTGVDGKVTGTQARDGLYRAQTPQGFRTDAILAAHRNGPADATDDVSLAIAAGLDVAIVPGDEDNLKITYEADFARALRIMGR